MLPRLERSPLTKEAISYFTFFIDHYKVLGLPSGEEITEQKILEVYKAQAIPCYCKSFGLPSNLPLEEIGEKVRAMGDPESILQQSINWQTENKSSCEQVGLLLISCCILFDPEKRKTFESWWRLAKWFERMKIINREKEKMNEYELMSPEDGLWIFKLYPWMVGGMLITLPVYLPVRICWLIGKASCKALQSVVVKRSDTFTDDKKASECSSSGEDIQDWELVNEDD